MPSRVKCVIILNSELPTGLLANTAAVLALSVGKAFPELIGDDLTDADGVCYPGITTIPVPVLAAAKDDLSSLARRLAEGPDSELRHFVVTNVAQRTKDYADYAEQLAQTGTDELSYLGVAICGPQKRVDSLSGSLPLLR